MSTSAYSKIRKRVREEITRDLDGDYWPDDVLDAWINEGQLNYCREGRVLRKRAPLQLKENIEVYTAPPDCYEILRIEAADGRLLEPTTSRELEGLIGGSNRGMSSRGTWLSTRSGADWLNKTGTPTHWFQDLDGRTQFRLYPRASPTIETAPVAFSGGPSPLSFKSSVRATISSPTANDSLACANGHLWWLATGINAIVRVDEDGQQVFSTYTTALDAEPTDVTVYNGPWNDYIAPLTAYCIACTGGAGGSQKRKFPPDGTPGTTSTTIGPGTGTFYNKILIGPGGYNLFYGSTTSGMIRYHGSTFSGVDSALASEVWYQGVAVPGSTVQTGNIYIAVGAGGLYKWPEITPGAGTQITTDDVRGIVNITPTVSYINVGGTLKRLTTDTDTITATAVTGLDAGPLRECGLDIYATRGNEIVRIDISDYPRGPEFIAETWINAFGELWAIDGPTSAVFQGRLAIIEAQNGTTPYIHQFDPDTGAVSSIDSVLADQETGAIVDYIDTEAPVYIDGEAGVVASITNDADAYILWYVADPPMDCLLVADEDAMVFYAAARCYQLDDEQMDVAAARIWEARYINRLALAREGSVKNWTTTRSRHTKGTYM
jgi:hypothetical protein